MRAVLNPKTLLKLATPAGADKVIFFDASESAPAQFGLRVRANGSRSFVVGYRTRTGTKRLMRVGGVRELSLAKAREAARAILARVAAGADPAAERRGDETAERVDDLVLAYVEMGKTRAGVARAAGTSADYRRAWASGIAGSSLGRMKPADVNARHLERFLDQKAKGAPVMADRLHALLRAAFRWALRRGRVTIDPTTRLDRIIQAHPRERVLSDEEVRALWLGVHAASNRELDEDGPRLSPVQGAALKVLLLLGQRLDETLRMRRADVDLSALTWKIPGPARKGGHPHVVPLSPAVAAILEHLAGDGAHVFAGSRGAPIAHNPSRFAEAVRAAAPDVKDWRLHDLRRTCASGCARLGASDEIVSRLLGHRGGGGVTAIYQRYDRLSEVGSALHAWAAHVARVVAGRDQADVVPMVRP